MPHAETNSKPSTNYSEDRHCHYPVAFALGVASGIRSRPATLSTLAVLSGQLVPNTDDLDQIIFRPLRDLTKVKFATPPESGVEYHRRPPL